MPDTHAGPYGAAVRVPRHHHTTGGLDAWILTVPEAHPIWSQYVLGLIRLADIPAAKADGVTETHELMVAALNPDHGPYDEDSVIRKEVRYLTPVNVVEHFTATDERAVEVAVLCVQAVLDGVLNPETGDAPDRIRAQWRQSIHRTLDHGRDPNHGALD